MGDEAEQCKTVDELQDKAGSLAWWSNTLAAPLGHYTREAALVSAFRMTLYSSIQAVSLLATYKTLFFPPLL